MYEGQLEHAEGVNALVFILTPRWIAYLLGLAPLVGMVQHDGSFHGYRGNC